MTEAQNIVASSSLDDLRARISDYEVYINNMAPRLAAFERLEELARSRSATPEAIAAEAGNELLRAEHRKLTAENDELCENRRELESDVAMLLQSRTKATNEMDELRVDYEGLQAEIVEILDELQMLRSDTVRLSAQRSELETEIARLRRELSGLQERRGQQTNGGEPTLAVGAPMRKTIGFEGDADEDRRFDDFFSDNVEHDKARDWILG